MNDADEYSAIMLRTSSTDEKTKKKLFSREKESHALTILPEALSTKTFLKACSQICININSVISFV